MSKLDSAIEVYTYHDGWVIAHHISGELYWFLNKQNTVCFCLCFEDGETLTGLPTFLAAAKKYYPDVWRKAMRWLVRSQIERNRNALDSTVNVERRQRSSRTKFIPELSS